MKIKILFILSLLVLSSIVYAHDDGDAGVTPDSALWGLDRALESIGFAFTFGDDDKARVALDHAHERILEVREMVAENKLEDAEKAKVEHSDKISQIKTRIKNIDSDDKDVVETEIELEADIESQEIELDELESEIEIKIKGELTSEQKLLLDSLIEILKDSNNEIRVEIQQKREEIKIKIKERTGKDDDAAEEEFERLENKTGLLELKKQKAEEQITEAEEAINDAKANLNDTKILSNAEEHLAKAKQAYEDGDYGEAYGQARAAESIADDVEDDDDEDDSEKQYVALGDQCNLVKFVCVVDKEYFRDGKGCGCKLIDDEDEDSDEDSDDDDSSGKKDGDKIYQSKNLEECLTTQILCQTGWSRFTDDEGCGCELIDDDSDDFDDDDYDPRDCELYGTNCRPGGSSDDALCEIGKKYENNAVDPVECKCPSGYEFKTISMSWGPCPREGMTDCPASVLECVKKS